MTPLDSRTATLTSRILRRTGGYGSVAYCTEPDCGRRSRVTKPQRPAGNAEGPTVLVLVLLVAQHNIMLP